MLHAVLHARRRIISVAIGGVCLPSLKAGSLSGAIGVLTGGIPLLLSSRVA